MTAMAEEQEQRPPLDGPTANDSDLDRALFGPYEEENR